MESRNMYVIVPVLQSSYCYSLLVRGWHLLLRVQLKFIVCRNVIPNKINIAVGTVIVWETSGHLSWKENSLWFSPSLLDSVLLSVAELYWRSSCHTIALPVLLQALAFSREYSLQYLASETVLNLAFSQVCLICIFSGSKGIFCWGFGCCFYSWEI